MTERVQGNQSAWRNHVPGGNGALCCAPQVTLAEDTEDFTVDPGQAAFSVDFLAGDCGLDEPLVVTAIADPFFPGSVAPIVGLVTVGPVGGVQVIRVLLDTQLPANGRFVLQFTNACGCCTIQTGLVQGL